MEWVNIKDKKPPLDSKIWFRTIGNELELHVIFLGMSIEERFCFRSLLGYVIEVPSEVEWRFSKLHFLEESQDAPSKPECSQ
jgi:hypothetical protein